MMHERAERCDAIAFDELEDGSRHLFELVVPGGDSFIPVHVLAGQGARPRLVAIAGVHGDEPDGILALLQASRRIDPRSLRGRLVIVPIAHPAAFEAGQRRSPIDGLDLNRLFPGSADGKPTERLAHALFDKVIAGSDFIFTLHSWYSTGTVLPFIEVQDAATESAALGLAAARASGFERIRLTTWPGGLLVRAADEIGIPGMEAEIGDGGVARPENQQRYLEHIDRLLLHIGMADGPPPETAHPAKLFRGRHIPSTAAGVLHMHVSLGEEVEENSRIADVENLHGQKVCAIVSPAAGTIVSRRSYGSVSIGDIVATLFSPAE